MKVVRSITILFLLLSLGFSQGIDDQLRLSRRSFLPAGVKPAVKSKAYTHKSVAKMYDANGDKIFENLSARISTAKPDEKIPVIVLYREFTPTAGTYRTRLQEFIPEKRPKNIYRNLPAVAVSLTPSEIKKILKDSWVDHIELDATARVSMATATHWFGVQNLKTYHGFSGDLDGIRGNYSGKDVVVAVADTGIDINHPDLQGKVLVWNDYVNGLTTPYDDNSHGTHVAGIIAGSGKKMPSLAGVAPEASLVVLKIANKDGSAEVSNIMQAIDDTILNKSQFNIRVLNLSVGVSGSSDGKDALSQLCNRAVANGIVVVVAAGNDGPNPRTIGIPAAANSVITVGAGEDCEYFGFYLAEFSSRGPTADGRVKPDLWGPGVTVMSPHLNGKYSAVDGTSFAAPFVSGVVALMIEGNPNLRPPAIKSILTHSTQKWSGTRNNEAGFGRLQAYQAVTRAAAITQNLHPPEVPRVGFAKDKIGDREQQDYVVNVTDKFPLAVTLVQLNENADIDLELYGPSGHLVQRSATPRRQERVWQVDILMPSGEYKIRVVSAFGSSDYLLNISGDWTQ